MGIDSEKHMAMQNSADYKESADSLNWNNSHLTLEQQNQIEKERKSQRKYHEKIEDKEHQKADFDLENDFSLLNIYNQEELNDFLAKDYTNNTRAGIIAQTFFDKQIFLGVTVKREKLKQYLLDNLNNTENILIENRVKIFTTTIRQGKSQTEILQLLISKFENEEAVSTWVDNWKNFLKLHQFAKSKSHIEQKAIQRIVSKADFTSEYAFAISLTEISNSTEISFVTKHEIQRNFKNTGISTINAFDQTLRREKKYKKSIEKKIQSRNESIETLSDDLQSLKSELDKLPPDSPKRLELETKVKQNEKLLSTYEQELSALKKAKPEKVQFQLRGNVLGALNLDGRRSVNIISENFTIQLPSNKLPFSGTRNLRSINLVFPYLILRSQNIADYIFSPNLHNNNIPNKENRKMGHLILSSLSIDDTKILSEENIKQLNTDLARLTSLPAKKGRECLTKLGIYDVALQSVNKKKLKKALKFIRENRGMLDRIFYVKFEQTMR